MKMVHCLRGMDIITLQRHMKRTVLAIAVIVMGLGFTSCNKEPQPLTKAQIKQKVDSITSVRIKESDERAQRDLELRIKIDVKVKADSIVNALEHPVKKTPVVMPSIKTSAQAPIKRGVF